MKRESYRRLAETVACLLAACVLGGGPLRAQCCSGCSNCCGTVCLDGMSCKDGQPIECAGSSEPYCPTTPIVIDVDGRGFFLTSLAGGVDFDILDKGHLNLVSWTQKGSTNAWLVLDRYGDGINAASDLFGNVTPQPPPPPGVPRNGFLALAVYDQPAYGGNGDGVINAQDAVFPRLRLWQDLNHDGVAQPDELKTLPELGIAGISLKYTESWREDQYGNTFRYVGTLFRMDGSPTPGVVDVILMVGRRSVPAGQ